jgi:hypothetical protein
MESKFWSVFYQHGRGYRVRRSFLSREAAQDFIDTNAMVFPLPLVNLVNGLTEDEEQENTP